jgi:GT2 family glycosyltransferase
MSWPARVDIAIVNFRSSEEVLTSLSDLGPWPHGTIWLVDNSCDALEAQALQRMAAMRSEIRVLVAGENLGFGKGCNLAYAQSSAEYFLLLNPDARIGQRDVRRLLDSLRHNVSLGAVSPATYWNAEKTFVLPSPSSQTPWAHALQVMASWIPSVTKRIAEYKAQRTQRQMARNRLLATDMLAGAVLLLRRSAVEAAGGLFEPGYFMFFEDADLSIRLRRSGYGLALLASAQAVHNYRHKPFKAELMAESQMRYFALRHPRYLRLSGCLHGLERLARPLKPGKIFKVLGEVDSAEKFRYVTQNARILAFSPSLLMMPAIVRPAGCAATSLSDSEWELLEPGAYVAWLECAHTGRWWVHFVRA